MSAALLNCNCQKRISFKLIGGHLHFIWSEFFDIFIVITFWFIMSFFSPHITASRSRDGWRMAISICDIFCRFFFFCFHTIFHLHFHTFHIFGAGFCQSIHFPTQEGQIFYSESLFFFFLKLAREITIVPRNLIKNFKINTLLWNCLALAKQLI